MSYEPGQKVGDYEVMEVLGAGGMGEVYKVRNVISDRVEAMKILLPDLAGQQELAGRFLREIKVLAGLEHPNIAALRTAQHVGNQLIMIMELVDGTTLAHRLRGGVFPEREALDFVDQVLAALSYAHARGIVHRDIKPANMMLTRAGVVKLMDFGIARAAGENKLTQTGSTLGSIYYMSPEQVQGQNIDARSDLYSLGASLYEMVTAQHPFEGDTGFTIMKGHIDGALVPPREVNPDLSPALNEVVLRSMAKDPNQRYQNADEFAGALQGVRRIIQTSARSVAAVAPTMAATTPSRPAFTQAPPAPAPYAPAVPTQALPQAMAATQSGSGPGVTAAGRAPTASNVGAVSGVTPAVPLATVAAVAPPSQTHAQTFAQPPAASAPLAVPPPPVPRSSRALYIALGSVLTIALLVLTAMKIPGLLGTSGTKPAAASPANSPAPPASAAPSLPAAAPPADSSAGATAAPAAAPPADTSAADSAEKKAERSRAAAEKKAQDAAAAKAEAEAQAKAEAEAKLFDEQENRFIHMSARAAAMKTSYETLRNQQAASGFSPNQDLTLAVTTLDQYLSRAEAALSVHDGATAQKYMDKAEPQIAILERKFGR